MTEKNRRKVELKERRLKAGTFIGCRPRREVPKTAYKRNRRATKAERSEL